MNIILSDVAILCRLGSWTLKQNKTPCSIFYVLFIGSNLNIKDKKSSGAWTDI